MPHHPTPPQASSWLQSHLRSKSPTLEVTTMHDARFATTLELAVRFGKTLVVAEVDRLEPLLFPLLRGDLERQGPRFVVQVSGGVKGVAVMSSCGGSRGGGCLWGCLDVAASMSPTNAWPAYCLHSMMLLPAGVAASSQHSGSCVCTAHHPVSIPCPHENVCCAPTDRRQGNRLQ